MGLNKKQKLDDSSSAAAGAPASGGEAAAAPAAGDVDMKEAAGEGGDAAAAAAAAAEDPASFAGALTGEALLLRCKGGAGQLQRWQKLGHGHERPTACLPACLPSRTASSLFLSATARTHVCPASLPSRSPSLQASTS